MATATAALNSFESFFETTLADADPEIFGAIRDGGVYIPLRGWDQRPSERQIEIRPFFVDKVLERTDWLELLRDMVAKSEIRLRVTGEYTPDRVADAQRVVEAGGIRGRPVLLF